MLKFISFGSGSSGNCYVLATSSDMLMIDIGVGVRGLKKACRDYGVSLSSVHHILAKKIDAELVRLVEKGRTEQIGDFLVTPFAVPHDSADNVGYFIEAGGTNICLITDAGLVTDEMKQYIQRARNLIIEANHDVEMVMNGPYPQFLKERILSGTGHLCNKDSAIAVAENMSEELQRVWLCHLSEENNHPELARKTVESVLRSYGIIPGTDLLLEVLKRTTPTGPYELK